MLFNLITNIFEINNFSNNLYKPRLMTMTMLETKIGTNSVVMSVVKNGAQLELPKQ